MKKFSVEYDPHALKKISKLDAPVRKRIKQWIEKILKVAKIRAVEENR